MNKELHNISKLFTEAQLNYILSPKKVVLRWNYKNNRYEPWQVSPNVALFKRDLEEIVDCCECGRQVKYGDCYTSLRVHNHSGFGYAVCEKCYEEERKEEEAYERNDI